jgi:hypothetical protein
MLVIVPRTRTVGGAACVCCIMPWARTASRDCMATTHKSATALGANTFHNLIIVLPERFRIIR